MPAMFALGQRADRQPGRRDVRGLRLVRACCCWSTSRGPMRDRLQAQAALALTGTVFVCLGTLAGAHAWLAAIAMARRRLRRAVRRRGELGAGRRDDGAAAVFILPVSLPGPGVLDPRPARRLGPGLGGRAARDRGSCGRRRCATPSAAPRSPPAATWPRACAARPRRRRARTAWRSLHDTRSSRRPTGPTGLTTAARAVVRLVDELEWLDAIVASRSAGPATTGRRTPCAVAAADGARPQRRAARRSRRGSTAGAARRARRSSGPSCRRWTAPRCELVPTRRREAVVARWTRASARRS